MPLTKDSMIPWGCVFKVIFPNNKIYVGSDTGRSACLNFFRYFGSPIKAQDEMVCELGDFLNGKEPYVLQKEILYAQDNVRVSEILRIEQQFIKMLHAKDPKIGYNR